MLYSKKLGWRWSKLHKRYELDSHGWISSNDEQRQQWQEENDNGVSNLKNMKKNMKQ